MPLGLFGGSSGVPVPAGSASSVPASASQRRSLLGPVSFALATLTLGAVASRVWSLRRPEWRAVAQSLVRASDPRGAWIVTGANSGLGRALALQLRQAGCTVILAVRDVQRGLDAKRWIEEQMGEVVRGSGDQKDTFDSALQSPSSPLLVLEVEIGDIASTHRFVARIRHLVQGGLKLAGLVNNAGVLVDQLSIDPRTNWESTLQTNHLGLVELTEQLLPLLEHASPSPTRAARVVNISSRLEVGAEVDLEDPFFSSRPYTPFGSYATSKRLMLAWSYARLMQLHQSGSHTELVCVTPGMVSTALNRTLTSVWHRRLAGQLFNLLFARPSDVAAQAVLHACLTPVRADGGMEYLGECRRVTSSQGARDLESQARITDWTNRTLADARSHLIASHRTRRALLVGFRLAQEACRGAMSPGEANVVRVFRQRINTGAAPPSSPHHAFLTFRGQTFPCAIGRAGIAPPYEKREGDGRTPSGTMPVRGLFVRADRGILLGSSDTLDSTSPATTAQDLLEAQQYPVLPIALDDVWVDDANSDLYNSFASLATLSSPDSEDAASSSSTSPSANTPSFEFLARDDHTYDLCFVLGHNDAPVRPSRGSAIFLHIAREASSSSSYAPTEGCIAVSRAHMDLLRAHFDCDTVVRVAEREEDTLHSASPPPPVRLNRAVSAPAASVEAVAAVRAALAQQQSVPEEESEQPASASATSPSSTLFRRHFADPPKVRRMSTAPPPDSGPAVIQFAAAADRNKMAIADALREHLTNMRESTPRVLELATGTGQHIAHLATVFTNVTFQPSDQGEDGFPSIAYYSRASSNVLPPICIDLLKEGTWNYPRHSYHGIYVSNMLHISSGGTTSGLFRASDAALVHDADARVFVYGPFMLHGQPTTESNRWFDERLKTMDSAYGLRDLFAVGASARSLGFTLLRVQDMPNANFMLVFGRSASPAQEESHLDDDITVEYARLDGQVEPLRLSSAPPHQN